jgi:hypothetical protein
MRSALVDGWIGWLMETHPAQRAPVRASTATRQPARAAVQTKSFARC